MPPSLSQLHGHICQPGCLGTRQLCGHGEQEAAPVPTPSPGQAPAGLPPSAQDPPKTLPRPRDTHLARSTGEVGTRRQQEVKEVFCLLGRSHNSNPSTEPWKFNCSRQGRCCQCCTAKLSQLFGPGEQLDVPERKTLHGNRRNCTVGKFKIRKPLSMLLF